MLQSLDSHLEVCVSFLPMGRSWFQNIFPCLQKVLQHLPLLQAAQCRSIPGLQQSSPKAQADLGRSNLHRVALSTPEKKRRKARTTLRPLCLIFTAQIPTSIQGKLLVHGEWLTEALLHVEQAEQIFHKKKSVSVYKFRACCLTRAPMCVWGALCLSCSFQ